MQCWGFVNDDLRLIVGLLVKTFSYNKKDLASGIESNAMCVTGIADYWVGCEVASDENYLNCHKYLGWRRCSRLSKVDISNIFIWV